MNGGWVQLLVCMALVLNAQCFMVDITYIESAVAKGAVCLDGSPPAYHFDKGSGAGINSWLVHIEGGGWCNNATTCLQRKSTRLGSSKEMVKQVVFSGIFSHQKKFNPDFYNWNRVKVRYCDGASFTGDVEAVDPATKLYYRGARIFDAVIDDLLAKGMRSATNAILSGCSAGGLTSILHCDNFKNFLPTSAKVKCLADAGFFINAKDVSGASHIQDFYDDVVTTHGSAKFLPQSCTSKMKPSLCFFPQNMLQGIRTPLFLVNAAIDSWQIKNILAPGVSDRHGRWHNCKTSIEKCSTSQLQTIEGWVTNAKLAFRRQFVDALTNGFMASGSTGYYINSCYAHCQTETQETWLRADSPVLNNKTIAKAVGDWFYDRFHFKSIDCPYPCDKTCHNRVFDTKEHPSI